MDKLNIFKDSSFEENDSSNETQKKTKTEKVLCNHCGRTNTNGIRCLGVCVADNEY